MEAIKLQKHVIKIARERGIIPDIPEINQVPTPAIHKVEWDLTFRCNDYCKHCLTDSGPKRPEFTRIAQTKKIISNIADHSLINRFNKLFSEVEINFRPPDIYKKLDNLKNPPKKLTFDLTNKYLNCLHGTNYVTSIKINGYNKKMNFGRPHIRLSGGEFFMWPYKINGKEISDECRLKYQDQLLDNIRKNLPEYDIWILTNGRFATDQDKTNEVIEYWSKTGNQQDNQGKLRICISVDAFHNPPPSSSVKDMLHRIWTACRHYNFPAPYLYGISSENIFNIGRAFYSLDIGPITPSKNSAMPSYNYIKTYRVIANDLVESNGCSEVKGFLVQIHDKYAIPVNNINIDPNGHLTFCCAQVGDYGDFVNDAENSLRNIMINPIAYMIRNKESAIKFLSLAVELDPTIKVFGKGKNAAAVGTTCYQLLTGKRINQK